MSAQSTLVVESSAEFLAVISGPLELNLMSFNLSSDYFIQDDYRYCIESQIVSC